MKTLAYKFFLRHITLVFASILVIFTATPSLSQEYKALEGVKELKTVFDYGKGSPEAALVIFPAIRGVYQSESVTSLPHSPSTTIVFHNQAVNLLTTERNGDAKENATLDKVAAMIRQFKKDGVRMEVCMYAVKLLGVDPDTIMPEIDKVKNGWVAVSGYQAQGYSLIGIPD